MSRTTRTPADASPAPAKKKQGRISQMIQVYRQTQEIDSSTLPMMLVGLIVPIVLFTAIMWLWLNSPFYGLFIGLLIGILAAMMILGRKAQAAAYSRISGQRGAALAATQAIRRGWDIEQEPCALDPRSQDMIFRASGRAGVALIAENDNNRSLQLLEKEQKRLHRLLPNVPVHTIIVGDDRDAGQVPLPKLASTMMRMKPTLTKDEAAQVSKRLQAMPNPIRQAVPRGIDPTRMRPNRRALRGR